LQQNFELTPFDWFRFQAYFLTNDFFLKCLDYAGGLPDSFPTDCFGVILDEAQALNNYPKIPSYTNPNELRPFGTAIVRWVKGKSLSVFLSGTTA